MAPPDSTRERSELDDFEASDSRLVGRCLEGDEEAWSTLVAKYKNLVFAIAVKQGIRRDDAADLFQAVWVQVYSKLDTLRKHGSIRSWLISVTLNACYHAKQKRGRRARHEALGLEETDADPRLAVDPPDLTGNEEGLLVQRAISALAPRCQELIRLLFYTQPPMPYKKVAERLGLAIGSIGFIRGRCLKKLHRLLEDQGIG